MALLRAFVPERLGPIAVAPDGMLLSAITDHLADVLGVRELPLATRISRWPAMMPKYTVGHLGRVTAAETGLAHLPGWRLAGSAIRGVGVPDCVADGRRQARLALDRTAAGADRVAS